MMKSHLSLRVIFQVTSNVIKSAHFLSHLKKTEFGYFKEKTDFVEIAMIYVDVC